VLFIHFEDLKRDFGAVQDRVAQFLGVTLSAEERALVAEHCSFAYMKDHEEFFEMAPPTMFSVDGGEFLASGKTARHDDVTPDKRSTLVRSGLEAMAERNARKAKLLYDTLDNSRVWKAHAKLGSRSNMNITWRGSSPELEDKLIAEAESRGLSGLRGHRSVGGMRASLYNAFPEEGVKRLVELLHDFEA